MPYPGFHSELRLRERDRIAPWQRAGWDNVNASFLFLPQRENADVGVESVYYVSDFERSFSYPGPALQMYQLFRKTGPEPCVPLLERLLIDQRNYKESVRDLQEQIVAKLGEMYGEEVWIGKYMFHGTSFVGAQEILRSGTIDPTPDVVNGQPRLLAWGANWLETALGYPEATHWKCGWHAKPLKGPELDGQRRVSLFDVQIAFIFMRPQETSYTSRGKGKGMTWAWAFGQRPRHVILVKAATRYRPMPAPGESKYKNCGGCMFMDDDEEQEALEMLCKKLGINEDAFDFLNTHGWLWVPLRRADGGLRWANDFLEYPGCQRYMNDGDAASPHYCPQAISMASPSELEDEKQEPLKWPFTPVASPSPDRSRTPRRSPLPSPDRMSSPFTSVEAAEEEEPKEEPTSPNEERVESAVPKEEPMPEEAPTSPKEEGVESQVATESAASPEHTEAPPSPVPIPHAWWPVTEQPVPSSASTNQHVAPLPPASIPVSPHATLEADDADPRYAVVKASAENESESVPIFGSMSSDLYTRGKAVLCGSEVVIERAGGEWALVRCYDGITGWLYWRNLRVVTQRNREQHRQAIPCTVDVQQFVSARPPLPLPMPTIDF